MRVRPPQILNNLVRKEQVKMTPQLFLILLAGFSALSSLVMEGIKKSFLSSKNVSYNVIALIIALIIGTSGTFIYYQLNNILIDTNNILYAILMGLASGLVSMVGYDKVKQTLDELKKYSVKEDAND